MPKLIHPHRTVATDGKITYQLRITSDVEAEVTIPAPTAQFPETNIIDARYKLAGNLPERNLRHITHTLHWLSGRAPHLTEQVLQCMEKEIPAEHHTSLGNILTHIAPPIPDCSDASQFEYFRLLINVSPVLYELASDNWRGHGPYDKTKASSLFKELLVTSTTLHDRSNLYNEVALIIWITQDFHDMTNVYPADQHKDDLDFIASRFNEVYNARHELRKRRITDRESISAYLDQKEAEHTTTV
jgi:hypothetical protein